MVNIVHVRESSRHASRGDEWLQEPPVSLSRKFYIEPWSQELLLVALFSLVLLSSCSPAPASCVTTCGNVSIPYPFATTPGCGLPQFQLSCSATVQGSPNLKFNGSGDAGPFFPFLDTPSGAFQVTDITFSSVIINVTNLKAESCDGPLIAAGTTSFFLDPESPYALSGNNLFFVNGCNSSGNVNTDVSSGTSCNTDCINIPPTNRFCNIYQCCISSLPAGARSVLIHGGGIRYQVGGCGFASMVYPPSYTTDNQTIIGEGQYGLELSYTVRNTSCSNVTDVFSTCSGNATCQEVDGLSGYVCEFDPATYVGDGYLHGSGCSDLDECTARSTNKCAADADCINTVGGYNCTCLSGYVGDGFANGTGCALSRNNQRGTIVFILVSVMVIGIFGLTALLLRCYFQFLQRRRKATQKSEAAITRIARYTASNLKSLNSHREMLQRSQKTEGDHLLTLEELEKATQNFCEENKVGTGGSGTVYKGILEQGTVVAIKKTNCVGIENIEQFFNEVTVLSQVNHRNLVKLIGCCIETEVPMVVYEYVANGTLYDYLQGLKGCNPLSWDDRLRIAIETAEALAYLHSAASPPIYHRDVKSANVLLDEFLTAKVADFGLSKLVPADVTHVSTVVKGTPGYIDPEYYLNYQVTDKSDVYGFGVILLELITGQKPVDFSRDSKSVSLASMALGYIKSGTLAELVDPLMQVDEFERLDQIQSVRKVADVAATCLAFQRVERPTMKEVVEKLARIRGGLVNSSSRSFSSPAPPFPRHIPPRSGDHLLDDEETLSQSDWRETSLLR